MFTKRIYQLIESLHDIDPNNIHKENIKGTLFEAFELANLLKEWENDYPWVDGNANCKICGVYISDREGSCGCSCEDVRKKIKNL